MSARYSGRITSFFRWWLAGLAGWVPGDLKRSWSAPAAWLCPGDERWTLLSGSGQAVSTASAIALADDEAFGRAVRRYAGGAGRLGLVVPRGLTLELSFTLPAETRVALGEAVALEVRRRSPLPPDDVVHCWNEGRSEANQGSIAIRAWIMARPALEPVLDRMTQLGIDRNRCLLSTDPMSDMHPAMLDGTDCPPRQERPWLRILTGLTIAAGFSVLWLFGSEIHSLVESRRTTDAEISRIAPVVDEVRQRRDRIEREIERYNSLVGEFVMQVSPGEVLDTLARIVPDDTWLEELRLDDGGVHLRGMSGNLPQLLEALARDSMFDEPALGAPVVPDRSQGADRFQIHAGLRRAGS